jgi:site-specific DNA recombinase
MEKAAGYVRVSSEKQTEGESLSTQRRSISSYCKANNYKLVEVYADEGISGGTVKERHALLRCLYDAQQEKFKVLIIHRLSRFGRNARELLNNYEELSQAGIELRSISEGIDFSSKYGKAMLGMLSVVAELERDIIRETMLENRIARGQKGIPTAGSLPFGRSFNRETNQWTLDEDIARLLKWTADEYLKGVSLKELSETLRTRHKLPLCYHNLIDVLSKKCGDKWTVTFKEQEPIVYNIPRILDDFTIQKIKDRLEHNRIECRKDVRKYVLTGFIRCEACGKSLSGQTQVNRYGTEFKYYNHPGGKYEKCKAFNSIPLEPIERAVFETVFQNISDVPSFEQAIADSLPDENLVKTLQDKVKTGQKELKRIEKELDKLIDLALSGALEKDTIRAREQELLRSKEKVTEELTNDKSKLDSIPKIEAVKREADDIRRELLMKYQSQEHLENMTFSEKKALMYFLFSGKDEKGTPYGIYISKKGKGQGAAIDYFLYGKVQGLRTLKGDNIDYDPGDDDIYKTNSEGCLQHHDLHPCPEQARNLGKEPG